MKELASTSNVYNVGITGHFKSNYPYHLNVLGEISKKLIQIISYCKKYNYEVSVYLDENAPFSFYKLLFAQGLMVKPVMQNENNVVQANHIETPNINDFLNRNCSYIMVICDKETKDDFDFEKPHKFYIEKPLMDKGSRLTPDPSVTLREAIYKARQNSDPYAAFFHEKLYTTTPFNYYDQIMQTKPDPNTLTEREFANADTKE